MSEKIDIMHRWNEAIALYIPKDNLWQAYIPYGHVKVILLWLSGWMVLVFLNAYRNNP